jgi:HK97 family phage major capsid protein
MVPPLGGDATTEDKIIRKFSVLNVARHLAGMKADVGFEREVTEEAAKQRGKPAEGIIIPFGVLANRAMDTLGSPGVVATNFGEYIDLLRSKYVIGRLGVTFLPGLVGNVALPKMTTGATGYWVAEAEDVTGSTPILGQVQGTPHTAGALVDISRTLLIQSTPSAEELVRNEIVERVMRTVQAALFVGSGSDGQPTGVKGTAGVNTPSVSTPGAPTYAEILDFPGDIMADNAEADGMKFAMTAAVWAKLAATLVGEDGGRTVLDPVARNCVGYGYEVTEDVGANTLFFGNWASVVLGIWGNGIDVAATDSKLFASGGLTLRALQDVDIMIRHPQALAYNDTVTV